MAASKPLISDEDIAREWTQTTPGFSWPQNFARRIESLVRKRLAERLRHEAQRLDFGIYNVAIDKANPEQTFEAGFKLALERIGKLARIVEGSDER